MENLKISARQFAILVILFSVGTTILVIPGSLANVVKQDAWITAIIGTVISCLIVALFVMIGRIFPAMTLAEIIETLLGKWAGKIISLSFFFFAYIAASELLYYSGTFLTTQIMPNTPIEAIHIVLACILLMGIRLGLETLARSAELFFPVFIFLFVLLVGSILITPDLWKLQNLEPILISGIKPMIRAVFIYLSVFSFPLIVLLMIFPISVKQPRAAEKLFFMAIGIAGVCLIILITLTILVLGPEASARQMYPSYNLARRIKIGDFLQRIEAVLAIMWFITLFFKMSLYFYAAIISLVQSLNIKDYRPFTFPLGMIMVMISLFSHPNVSHSAKFDYEIWTVYSLIYGLALPLLLLIIHGLRKCIRNDK
ncbi:endospore germination permease [Neobacillus sp. 114]|uniref:GerAB/ArcD/ProY family transporter n=1 Tax=Neobacillus sp. 114 TaxID=3048535 RepID=UPI0024C3EB63|nr:endospore germination permease [Neobacillus sp. 114]